MMEAQGLSVDYHKKDLLEEVYEEEKNIFTNIILKNLDAQLRKFNNHELLAQEQASIDFEAYGS